MKINKKDKFTAIEYDVEDKERVCLYCEKEHVRSKLTRRPNYEEVDKDMWLYCPNCHRSFLMRETRMEGRLKAAVDTKMDEDDDKTVMGLDNLLERDSQAKKIQDRLKKEKDPDVRALIKQGYAVEENKDEVTRS